MCYLKRMASSCQDLENENKKLNEQLKETERELDVVKRLLTQYQTTQVASLHEKRLRALRELEKDHHQKKYRFFLLNGQAGKPTCYDELLEELKSEHPDSNLSEDEIG